MLRSIPADKPATAREAGSSARKKKAILDAAMKAFLKSGYLGASMDEIAAMAQVSKQTVYKQFSNKESLFTEMVFSLTDSASNKVHNNVPEFTSPGEVADYLQLYAYRQLTIVLTPPIMQLRRLVIGEVSRFPEMARVLYQRGPQRAMTAFAKMLEHLAKLDMLTIDDPMLAASQFNWLVMGEPINRAMLLGDDAIPKHGALRRHAAECVRVFLAAYGKKSTVS
jgi:TetR/AcrR family transcriptional repressor of mexJK operon